MPDEIKTAPADRRISENLKPVAKALSELLEELAGQRMQFSLIVFNSVPGSRLNYVSNCHRDDVIAAMKSLLKGWENGMPDIPTHEIS